LERKLEKSLKPYNDGVITERTFWID